MCWGADDFGQATPPNDTLVKLSGGAAHMCGIRTDGTVACWGFNLLAQASPPGDLFVSLASSYGHNCGVRTNGQVECWGFNNKNQITDTCQ